MLILDQEPYVISLAPMETSIALVDVKLPGMGLSVVETPNDEIKLYLFDLLQGEKGDRGEQGAPGPAGPKGAKGDTGDVGATGATGAQGEPGPEGPPGLQGIQGEQGEVGPAGPAGPEGPQGDVGPIGPEGPVGATGPTGDTGPAGADGVNGIDGDDGLSAYEVAVAEGFVGDEAAWLASLVGPTGATGAAGPPGADGVDGVDGADGAPGVGVPTGGTAGQFLRKVDGVDYNTAWYTLVAADIPDLDADKITTGTFADARIAESNVTQHEAALSIDWSQLASVPSTFTPSAHTHAAADVTSGTFADARISQSSVTQHQAALAIGWGQLTGSPPSLLVTDVYTVGSQAAQLALVAEEGDIAIRTDLNKSFAHNGGTAGTMADWSELLTPTDAVLSFNGRTGAITLTSGDVTGALGYTPVNRAGDTMTGDLLVNKSSAIIGLGTSGSRNGGIANFSGTGLGHIGLFSENAGGAIYLRPEGRNSATAQALFTAAGLEYAGALIRYWNSADTDIDGLIPGTAAGFLIEGTNSGHVTIGLRSNDANDGFYILDKGNAATPLTDPYVNLVFGVSRAGFSYTGGAATFNGALTAGGTLTVNSSIISSQNFISSSVNVVLATTGTGSVYLRPNGAGSATGQLQVNSSGVAWGGNTIYHAGNFTPSSKWDTSAATAAGLVNFATVASYNDPTTLPFVAYNGSNTTTDGPAANYYGGIYAGRVASAGVQLAIRETPSDANREMWYRGKSGGVFTAWCRVWDSQNFTPGDYLPIAGGTLTGNLTISKSNATLRVNSTDNATPSISLERPAGRSYQIVNDAAALRVIRGSGASFSLSDVVALYSGGLWQFYDDSSVTTLSVDGTSLRYKGTAVMLSSWNINAGNGLTGGGSGAADRTLTLGTPTTLTASTTNAVTTTSHTHAITGFLPLTGGTLTGALTCSNAAGIDASAGPVQDSIGNVRDIPPVLRNSTAAFTSADRGKLIYKNNTTAYTWTVNSGATAGWAITVGNRGAAGNVTIGTSGVTLYWEGGSGSSYTLPPGAHRLLVCESSTIWWVI